MGGPGHRFLLTKPISDKNIKEKKSVDPARAKGFENASIKTKKRCIRYNTALFILYTSHGALGNLKHGLLLADVIGILF